MHFIARFLRFIAFPWLLDLLKPRVTPSQSAPADNINEEIIMSPQPVHLKSPKRWRLPLIGLLVVGLAGGGWTVMRSQAKPAETAKGAAAKPAPVLELATADVAAIQARRLAVGLPLSGSLIPVQQATIKSKVSGQVQDAALREGVSVQEGQILARLDQADLKARLQQQQAMLEEAQARLSMAQKNEYNAKALRYHRQRRRTGARQRQIRFRHGRAGPHRPQRQRDPRPDRRHHLQTSCAGGR
jgi:multidrug efflux pump subunit AcrA (membrane-fusion protein)